MSFKRILIFLPVHTLARLVHLETESSPKALPVNQYQYFNNVTICGENSSSFHNINRYTVYEKFYFHLTKQKAKFYPKNISNLRFNRHHKSER